jgi:hypothetical protein
MFALARLAVGLEPLNAPDAACIVRPGPGFPEIWIPRWPDSNQAIKQTKNWRKKMGNPKKSQAHVCKSQ